MRSSLQNFNKRWTSLPKLVRIVLTRLVTFVPQLVGAVAVTFALIRLLPGDPALTLLGNLATPEAIASLRERLGLDRGILEQFVRYALNVAHGDLGSSILTANPVTTDLMDRAPATFELLFYALITTVTFGIVMAALGVLRPGRLLDRAGQGYGMLAGVIPDF